MSRNPSIISSVQPQETGQSSATLDAAYEGVFSQLDALASQSLALNNPSTAPIPNPIPTAMYPRYFTTGAAELEPLEAVSERTEPLSSAASMRSSTGTIGAKSDFSSNSIARRFPLPGSPSKGLSPGSTGRDSTPQASPKKASDLIKMFEQRGTGPPSQPSFTPSTSRTSAFASVPRDASISPPVFTRRPLEDMFDPISPAPAAPPTVAPAVPPVIPLAAPPSSYRYPAETAPLLGPTPPPKSPSPLSQVRTMIASWKARAGSPAQRVVGSPGKGDETPRLFGRDRGWNVSIRRRKRHEAAEPTLAESSDDPAPPPARETKPSNIANDPEMSDGQRGEEAERESSPGGARTPSLRSFRSAKSSIRTLTGEVDLSLHRMGLELTNSLCELDHCGISWFTLAQCQSGCRPMLRYTMRACGWYGGIQKDLVQGYCLTWWIARVSTFLDVVVDFSEVSSMYSPTHPMADDDIGAVAARQNPEFAAVLHPFKLVSVFSTLSVVISCVGL